jgi:hypothetical protein
LGSSTQACQHIGNTQFDVNIHVLDACHTLRFTTACTDHLINTGVCFLSASRNGQYNASSQLRCFNDCCPCIAAARPSTAVAGSRAATAQALSDVHQPYVVHHSAALLVFDNSHAQNIRCIIDVTYETCTRCTGGFSAQSHASLSPMPALDILSKLTVQLQQHRQ